MRSSAISWAAVGALALGAAVTGAACTGSKGQLMLVFQTDMSLPKDIDSIQLRVTLEGAVVYDKTFERLGGEGSIRLPATLGFLTPEDPTQALRVRLTANRGDTARVVRDVVTTVPEGRTATLQLPIQFLCDGSAKEESNGSGEEDVKSGCDEGQTCDAGACVKSTVDSGRLPDFVPEEVYGGGTGSGDGACFDTVKCFEGAVTAELDLDAFAADPTVCRAAAGGGGGVNMALLTQGGGICGQTACYVPLDGESDAGFREKDGAILLPPAVCERVKEGKLLGVVTAAAGEGACQQKRVSLPTCGPWSASGADQYKPPDGVLPTLLVAGQTHPGSLAVAPSGVYWIAGSTFDASGAPIRDGQVKTVPLGGGEPTVIADEQPSPRDLVVDDARQLVFWTNAGMGQAGAVDGAVMAAAPGVIEPIPLFGALRKPEGIARFGDALYWTQLYGDEVFRGTTSGAGADVSEGGDVPVSLTSPGGPLGASPYRIAVAADLVCWTYQGELQVESGGVACQRPGNTAEVIAQPQVTPRSIVLDVDAGGNATAVYWANFEAGKIFRVEHAGGTFGDPLPVATNQALPSGLAIDAERIYWTNRGDGTVMRLAKGLAGTSSPEVIASGQLRPGAIAVDDAAVYWVNEGSPDLSDGRPAKDGAILKLPK